MKIERLEITIADLVQDYHDDGEGGVVGYGGKLDIRPPYQREFIYQGSQRNAVIDSVIKNYPLNVMYWTIRDDGTYEVLDGQQRTISIAQYRQGFFSIQYKGRPAFYDNLDDGIKHRILNYELTIYVCDGTREEKTEWFKIINIAGAQLSDQELRNAIYSGPWVSDAKRYFSRRNRYAHREGNPYIQAKVKLDRQEYLETAIKWISGSTGNIDGYMAANQHQPDAESLWTYFQSVIDWIKTTFTDYRADMKKVPDWGSLYRAYKDYALDPAAIEAETAKLMQDYDVRNKPGIYSYILTREEKHLNIRRFDQPMKTTAYERQGGICPSCKKSFKMPEMDADHKKPWSKGGKTDADNCQMLCRPCNQSKSSK